MPSSTLGVNDRIRSSMMHKIDCNKKFVYCLWLLVLVSRSFVSSTALLSSQSCSFQECASVSRSQGQVFYCLKVVCFKVYQACASILITALIVSF